MEVEEGEMEIKGMKSTWQLYFAFHQNFFAEISQITCRTRNFTSVSSILFVFFVFLAFIGIYLVTVYVIIHFI